jgi:hypothetical protein
LYKATQNCPLLHEGANSSCLETRQRLSIRPKRFSSLVKIRLAKARRLQFKRLTSTGETDVHFHQVFLTVAGLAIHALALFELRAGSVSFGEKMTSSRSSDPISFWIQLSFKLLLAIFCIIIVYLSIR